MLEDRYTSGEHLKMVPGWHVEESPWKAKHILRILQNNQLTPQTICEVGCGFGEVLKQLQMQMSEACEFWGYEISPQAFEQTKARANERLHFKLADICQELGIIFDLMLVLDVVEHVEDYLGFLQQLRFKSQYSLFQIPLDLSAQTVVRGKTLPRLRSTLGHLHYFTKETAFQTLEDSGYRILDFSYTSSSTELPTHIPTVKLLKWPRKLFFTLNQDLAVRALGGYRIMILATSMKQIP